MASTGAGLIERRVLGRGAGWAAIVLVLGLASGAAMAAVAGGRRAATSYDRFLAWEGGADAITGSSANSSEEADQVLTAAAALPQVQQAGRNVALGDRLEVHGHVLPFLALFAIAIDESTPIGRVKMIHGRLPDMASAHEAFTDFDTAARLDLAVGDVVTIWFDPHEDDPPDAVPVPDQVTIVGVGVVSGQFPTLNSGPDPVVLLTPAFMAAHRDAIDWTNGGLILKLKRGADDVPAFRDALRDAGLPFDNIQSIEEGAVGVRRLMRVEAAVLWFVAVVLAGAAAVVITELFRRQAAAAGRDLRVLGALGMTRRQAIEIGASYGVRAGSVAGAAGVALAVALSPLLPRGIARTAEPHVGVHVDVVVLAAGWVATVALAVAASTLAVLLAVRVSRLRPARRPIVSAWAGHLPAAPATGTRLAFGRTAPGPGAAMRLGLLGVAAILTTMVATIGMRASFDRVVADPNLAGATWDTTFVFDDDARIGRVDELRQQLLTEPEVGAATRGGWSTLLVNGRPVFTAEYETGTPLAVATDQGRAPRSSDEIALGRAEMSALHVSIGDTVQVAPPDGEGSLTPAAEAVTLKVVGRAVVSAPRYQRLNQGEGAGVTLDLVRRFVGNDIGRDAPSVFVRLRDRNDLAAASVALADRYQPNFWFNRTDLARAQSLGAMRTIPTAMIGLLAVMALVTLVHRLLVTSKAQRRDLAVLRSLGFTNRQLFSVGGTEGGVVALLALGLAVPAGLLVSAFTWRWMAHYLAVLPRPVVPGALTIAVVVATLGIGVVAGSLVAERIRRQRAGVLLRTE